MPTSSGKNFETNTEKAMPDSLILMPFYTIEGRYILEVSLKINNKKAI